MPFNGMVWADFFVCGTPSPAETLFEMMLLMLLCIWMCMWESLLRVSRLCVVYAFVVSEHFWVCVRMLLCVSVLHNTQRRRRRPVLNALFCAVMWFSIWDYVRYGCVVAHYLRDCLTKQQGDLCVSLPKSLSLFSGDPQMFIMLQVSGHPARECANNRYRSSFTQLPHHQTNYAQTNLPRFGQQHC